MVIDRLVYCGRGNVNFWNSEVVCFFKWGLNVLVIGELCSG